MWNLTRRMEVPGLGEDGISLINGDVSFEP